MAEIPPEFFVALFSDEGPPLGAVADASAAVAIAFARWLLRWN